MGARNVKQPFSEYIAAADRATLERIVTELEAQRLEYRNTIMQLVRTIVSHNYTDFLDEVIAVNDARRVLRRGSRLRRIQREKMRVH